MIPVIINALPNPISRHYRLGKDYDPGKHDQDVVIAVVIMFTVPHISEGSRHQQKSQHVKRTDPTSDSLSGIIRVLTQVCMPRAEKEIRLL